jgi:hypothetical protein
VERALRVRCEPGIAWPLWVAEGLREANEEPIVRDRDRDLAVRRAVGAERCAQRVVVPKRLDRVVAVQRTHRDRLEQRDQTVEHRDIDVSTDARSLPLVERRERAERAVEAGHEIAEADRRTRRTPADRTGRGHQTRHPLDEQVIGGQVAHWPVLAEAGDADDDEARVQPRHLHDRQPEAFERSGPEVLDQDVRAFEQSAEDGELVRAFEVERDAELVAVQEPVVRARSVDERAESAGVVSARRLDLDHLGAEIGEQHPAERSRKNTSELEDPDPG